MTMDALRAPTSQRPSSSLSNRPISRSSQRSVSRLSQRGIARPRLVAFLKTLVVKITRLDIEHDAEEIHEAVVAASKRIDQMKQSSPSDSVQVNAHFNGHIRKLRIHMQDTLADALLKKYKELKDLVYTQDSDLDIKPATLPNNLELLLLLSSLPTSATVSFATEILTVSYPTPQLPPLSWNQILAEEPFEGQHWQGAYRLPEGSNVDHWEDESSNGDTSSLLGVPDLEEDKILSSEGNESSVRCQAPLREQSSSKVKVSSGRTIAEGLQEIQYWRSGWATDADLYRSFNIGDASTLGAALNYMLPNDIKSFAGSDLETFIDEAHAIREILTTLQGCKSCLFEIEPSYDVKVLHGRRIVHLTRTSQASILESFATYASVLTPLRHLIRTTYGLPTSLTSRCRTVEAFTAAVNDQLIEFERWCAQQEERICLSQHGSYGSDHVISLLSLEKEVVSRLSGAFKIFLSIVRSVESKKKILPSPVLSAFILNALMDAAQTQFSIGERITAHSLMEVWRESVEPVWTNIGRWLKDGIPVRTGFEGETYKAKPSWDDEEFFIRANPLIDLGSPEFWEGGYTLFPCHGTTSPTLHEESCLEQGGIPCFLQHVAEDVLAAGKAVGLLRGLHMVHLVGDHWLDKWCTFKSVTETLPLRGLIGDLEHMISEALLPSCRLAQSWLRYVLVNECGLWKHIEGFESVYLMMRGDAMSQFGEKLFNRMDSRQPWNDFHFLNTAFRDVTKLGPTPWIDSYLIRFSHRGNKDRSINRTVRAIDGLFVEYTAPFPLTYIFGPEVNTSYSVLFNFLLQLRRSKSVLDRILIRGWTNSSLDHGTLDLKAFYALRSRLSWFVNTLLNFVMTNVIHTGLLEFHEALRKAISLDEMLSYHRVHLDKLLGRCLLSPNASALHRAILSILDLSLHFGDHFSAFAGDNSLDISRRSLINMRRRHRWHGRNGRNHRPDVIGFADTLPASKDSDSGSDDNDEEITSDSGPADTASISFIEENFIVRLDKMSSELDGLVRFVRRGVESLASGANEAASTFGILAFCLEDWDL